MPRRAGIQTEVLVSLAVVMLLSTVGVSAVWAVRHEATLRALVGRALLQEARAVVPAPPGRALFPGTDWWEVSEGDLIRPRAGVGRALDRETRALALEARRTGRPLLRPGAVWEEMRFAAPLANGRDVVLARLPRETSLRLRAVPLLVGAGVLLADALIFTAFGVVLLRRRVVGPLQRLSHTARALAEGAPGVRAREEGSAEAAELARSFNDMTDALEGRSEELHKAVVGLRSANADLRLAREGLDRAERLAAVGRLASGVAHEVGNPIGAILAFLDLARRDPGISEDTRSHLARAGREGERVRVILRQLLDFSRPRRGEPVPVDLTRAASEACDLLHAQRRYAELHFEASSRPGAPPALAEPEAIAQVLLNLLLNAADAALEPVEGAPSFSDDVERLVIRVVVEPAALHGRAEDDGDPAGWARRHPDAVRCVIADRGPGVAEEDRERIFDPFFTTKPPGEGTGLGLANAARMAEEQGGRVSLVEPPEGFSTAFALTLPVPRRPDAGEPGHDPDPAAAQPSADPASPFGVRRRR